MAPVAAVETTTANHWLKRLTLATDPLPDDPGTWAPSHQDVSVEFVELGCRRHQRPLHDVHHPRSHPLPTMTIPELVVDDDVQPFESDAPGSVPLLPREQEDVVHELVHVICGVLVLQQRLDATTHHRPVSREERRKRNVTRVSRRVPPDAHPRRIRTSSDPQLVTSVYSFASFAAHNWRATIRTSSVWRECRSGRALFRSCARPLYSRAPHRLTPPPGNDTIVTPSVLVTAQAS